MESTPTLYDTLFSIFGQYRHWLDTGRVQSREGDLKLR